jgi:ribosomal protein S18 acetylase RimI-like enzyme
VRREPLSARVAWQTSRVNVQVREASTPEDYAAFAVLIAEYEQWLLARYETVSGLVAAVRAHQDLDAELASLPEKYASPRGAVLLAERDGEVLGGVAVRDLHDGTCEMKRLYVRAAAQGSGAGRLLCERLLELAGSVGYTAMRLDTGFRNEEALALYRSLGFEERDAYAEYPPDVVPYLRFLERPLP